jgi:hypothetical protein
MVRRTLKILAVSILVAPSVTWAVPIKVDFTITAFEANYTDNTEEPSDSYNGYPIGTVGTGSFTFDDAVGDFFDIVDGLTANDLQFSWLGRMWDEGNARITRLSFDGLGNLRTWEIDAWIPDSDCNLSCVSNLGGPAPDFFAFESGFGASGFLHEPDVQGWMSGSIEWSAHSMTVPEPATFALFALGLLASGVLRLTGGERTNR